MSPAGPLQAIPSTAASSAPETQQASSTPAVCVWPMLRLNATHGYSIKDISKSVRKAIGYEDTPNVWQKPEWRENMRGWRMRCIFHSDSSAKRNIKMYFRARLALCKYSLPPCDTDHLSTSAAVPVSPVHNLSLKQRRARHWRSRTQDLEGVQPDDWWGSKVHYGPGAKRRSQAASCFELSQVFSTYNARLMLNCWCKQRWHKTLTQTLTRSQKEGTIYDWGLTISYKSYRAHLCTSFTSNWGILVPKRYILVL